MKIGVIGLGLIGGTIARSLNEKHEISGYDISEDTLSYAIDKNIIQNAYHDVESFIKNNDVFYLCLYPKDIVDFINNNAKYFKKNDLIIEISGIKEYLISNLKTDLSSNFEVVFSHPIAGSEKIGITHSNKQIFKNANYVITPTTTNKNESINTAISLAKEMGFQNISLVSPKQHDSIIAYTSQLTHILSLSLVNSISTSLDTKKFIGDSYRDLTRISKINENLWPDLFIGNKTALVNKINAFETELRKFKDAIIMNDRQKLCDLMIKSTKIRNGIDEGGNDES